MGEAGRGRRVADRGFRLQGPEHLPEQRHHEHRADGHARDQVPDQPAAAGPAPVLARPVVHCGSHQSASPCRYRNWRKVISPTTMIRTIDIALARPTLKSANAVW